MADIRPRVKVPGSVAKGEVFEVKTLVSHKMETGQRKDRKTGKTVPRKILNTFTATFDGKEVFKSDWHPAISANPFISFYMKAEKSGELTLTWTDDDGKSFSKKAKITVKG